ncbi:MAG: SufD family Fe-S cluster assembly protein [Alphaproteobacteria bacterium]|nr:SufD family Fe-S cluster assembly protein [Alphaproteobacteria bacterium]
MSAALKLPGRKVEDWRWTDLSALEAARASAPANDAAPDWRQWLIDGLTGPVVVLVDGRLVHEAGIDVLPASTSLSMSGLGGLHERAPGHPPTPLMLSEVEARTPLRAAALASATAGLTLALGTGHATSGPIQLIHIATGGEAHLVHRIELAADAQASIVETYAGAPGSWTNIAAEIALGEGARLMRSVRRAGAGGVHTETSAATVGQGASYHAALLLAGAEQARVETAVTLTGFGAFAGVDGVLLGRDRQTYDIVTRLRHEAEHGSSRQTWRSVGDEQATLSVSGRVEVARGAQKTDAEQSVKALLLQRTAAANAKPELEIFADDVKCAHGATVGELDRQALFYLASRGIEPAEARALLTESFVADALATIGEEAIREALHADAVAWLRGLA